MSTFRAYLVTPPSGPREFHTVGAESARRARELGGTAETIELPATKAGLIPFLNTLEAEHAAARDGLNLRPSSAPIEHQVDDQAPAANDDDELDEQLDVRVLESQVEALGRAGEKGLAELEGLQQLSGIGATFSRGVHLLAIVAAGEHQLARIFLRDRKRSR